MEPQEAAKKALEELYGAVPFLVLTFLSFTSLGDTKFSWEWAKSYGLTIAGLDEAKANALCKWKLAVLLLTEARFIAKLVEAGFEEPVATEAWDKIPKKRTYSSYSVACALLTPFRSRVRPSSGATQWCVSPVCCAPSSVYLVAFICVLYFCRVCMTVLLCWSCRVICDISHLRSTCYSPCCIFTFSALARPLATSLAPSLCTYLSYHVPCATCCVLCCTVLCVKF
jgi:hypothetical protein